MGLNTKNIRTLLETQNKEKRLTMNILSLANTPEAKAAVPLHFKKYIVNWMPLFEYNSSERGEKLIQHFITEKFSAHYEVSLQESTQEDEAISESGSFLFNFQLNGKLCVNYQCERESFSQNESTYCTISFPPGKSTYTTLPGLTERLYFQLAESYVNTLEEDFKSIRAISSDSSLNNYIKASIVTHLDSYTEDLLRNELLKNDTSQNSTNVKVFIYQLLFHYESQLVGNYRRRPVSERYLNVICQIKKEVRENPNKNNLTDEYFSKKYAIGVVTMNRYFKLITGVTLASFKHNLSMAKAKELIESGLTFNEIAEIIGYSVPNNFTKAFKEYFGYAPSKFRKRIKILG